MPFRHGSVAVIKFNSDLMLFHENEGSTEGVVLRKRRKSYFGRSLVVNRIDNNSNVNGNNNLNNNNDRFAGIVTLTAGTFYFWVFGA